jgi:hypothetical protein
VATSPPPEPADLARPTDLAARYGRTPSVKRRTRIVVAASALAFVIVFVAWIVWAGLLGPSAQFESSDTGYTITGDDGVTVRWSLSMDPGRTAACAVQALNSTFAIIGWKIVEVPASTLRTRDFSEPVRTTELAVTGLIYRCWLT